MKISKLNLFLIMAVKLLSGDLMIIPILVGMISEKSPREGYLVSC